MAMPLIRSRPVAPQAQQHAGALATAPMMPKTHLKHCYQKTGARRQTELIRLALASAASLLRRRG